MSKKLAAHLARYHPRADWTPAMMLATLQAHDAEIARLTKLFADSKQKAELARNYGGHFDGKSVIEWEQQAFRYESGIRWNRGRLVETL